MSAYTPSTDGSWKRVFVVAEAFVVFGCIYGVALRITGRYDVGEHPNVMAAYRVLFPMLRPMFYCFLAASVFLMLASPFFVRSLRAAAARAWIIGVAALLCAGFLFFVR